MRKATTLLVWAVMNGVAPDIVGLAAALGVGLLIGLERERSKGTGPHRKPGGIRTFALFALAGAIAAAADNPWLTPAVVLAAGAFAAVAYHHSAAEDPGLTTEIALVVTTLLGILAYSNPVIGAGLGVVVAIMLAARTRLHQFVLDQLNAQEVHDGLILAAAAMVILPLLPERTIDPFGALSPRVIWMLAVLVMSINAVGYVALRAFGATVGLPLSGFAGGFVSSTATHGAMGSRALADPALLKPAIAGAALSSLATPIFMMIVLAVANREVMTAMLMPMALSGLGALAYGALFTWRAAQSPQRAMELGRPFSPRDALIFTATVSSVIFVAALLEHLFGTTGAVVGVSLAGLADTQAAGASAASLAASGNLSVQQASIAVLIAFSLNAAMKVVVSWMTGRAAFALRVLPGQVLMVGLAWAGWVLAAWLRS
ncbi:MAG: mgtC family protein [Proteobacteria bacterium]|nr:mgtC family protein [Pseudomonadota bacterium]